jgi:hypothetical protein
MIIGVAVGAAIFTPPAAAAEPTHYPFAFSFQTVLTDVCSFPVNVDAAVSGTGIDYFDKSGALTRTFLHTVEQDTFTANGKTLVSLPYDVNIEILFDSSGNVTKFFASGVFSKILLPDGSLFVSAGRAEFVHHGVIYLLSPDKGNSGNLAGFCAALAP